MPGSQRERRHRREERVDAIEDAAMPGKKRPAVLDAGTGASACDSNRSPTIDSAATPMQNASHATIAAADIDGAYAGRRRQRQQQQRIDDDAEQRAIDAFPRLARTDPGGELAPTEAPAGEIRGVSAIHTTAIAASSDRRRARLQRDDRNERALEDDETADRQGERRAGLPVAKHRRQRDGDPVKRSRRRRRR